MHMRSGIGLLCKGYQILKQGQLAGVKTPIVICIKMNGLILAK